MLLSSVPASITARIPAICGMMLVGTTIGTTTINAVVRGT